MKDLLNINCAPELGSAQIQTLSRNKWDVSLARDNHCILTNNWLS